MAAAHAAAAAQGSGAAQRWNIMLVIDRSGSLNPGKDRAGTDWNGLRYEAISSFLSVLQDDGHNIGSVVFSGTDASVASDENMRSDKVMKLREIQPIFGQSDKNALFNYIKDAGVDTNEIGGTDIGTALLMAAEQLDAMNNGLPGAIFLFTDGGTKFHGGEALVRRSNENRDKAIEIIKNKGIELCGALLNAGGKDHDAAVNLMDIVSRANEIQPYDEAWGNHYVEITDNVSLISSIDAFLRMLGFGFADAQDKEEFYVPGVGVEEVSIQLRAKNGRDLPQGVTVTLVKPDGTKIDGSTLKASGSKTQETYKVQNPDPGLWKINVVRPENSPVEIGSIVFLSNANLDSRVKATPLIPDVIVGQPLTIECYLEQNGALITGKDAYEGYICTLSVTDCTTGDTQEYNLTLDPATGTFTQSWQFDQYNEYDVSVRFELDEEYSWENISYRSAAEHWVIANHLPKLTQSGMEKSCIYSIFFGKNQAIDLTGCAVDDEDGTNLTYTVTGDNKINMDGVTLDGMELKIQPKVAGSGVVELLVADSDGGVSTMTIKLSSHSITWLIILLVVAALIVALIVINILPKPARPEGTCPLSLSFQNWSGFGAGKLDLSVNLAPPGFNGTKYKTNLYEMIRGDLADEYSSVKQELAKKGISEDIFTQQLQSSQKILESYKISCVNQKIKDEDGQVRTVALLKFQDTANKHTDVLGVGGLCAMVNANTDTQAIAITFDYQPE